MGWLIGRTAAMSDPEAARRKALEKLRGLAEMDDPEGVVVPILLDAILLVESYRGARHQITFLDDLTASVDALLREMTILEKSKDWAAE
ncbi:MAG TPA: hypothetical protein VIJ81_03555 [Sphingomicrobium sp.]|jgi:hypothetical protein|nr:hypothetical protein [Sphingomicrobium sp.]